MADFEAIKSSNLDGAKYDRETGKMQIAFKSGAVYEYSEISPASYEKFAETFQSEASSGSYFHKNFRHLKATRIDKKPE